MEIWITRTTFGYSVIAGDDVAEFASADEAIAALVNLGISAAAALSGVNSADEFESGFQFS